MSSFFQRIKARSTIGEKRIRKDTSKPSRQRLQYKWQFTHIYRHFPSVQNNKINKNHLIIPGFRAIFLYSYVISVYETIPFFPLKVLFISHHLAQMTSGVFIILLFSIEYKMILVIPDFSLSHTLLLDKFLSECSPHIACSFPFEQEIPQENGLFIFFFFNPESETVFIVQLP